MQDPSEQRLEIYKIKLLTIIHSYVPSCTVYLFGSRARKTNKESADIDLALDAGKPIEFRIMSKIRGDIEDSTIPVFVDLVDLQNIPEKLKNEIARDGVVWKN